MTYRSGLASQVGFAAETTVGTEVTVTKFIEFKSETLESVVDFQEAEGLKSGAGFQRRSRVAPTRYSVKGDLELELADRNLGALLKQMTGAAVSAPTQIGVTGAYQTYFDPGEQAGKGLTFQVGRPRYSGTVVPSTYRGCKVPSWEISLADDGILMLKTSIDGWRHTTVTALASASYPTGITPFRAIEAVVTIDSSGGAPVLSSGQVNLSVGAGPFTGILRSFSMKCDTPMDTARFGIGNAGTKGEQFENDFGKVTCDLEMDHATGTAHVASTMLETAGSTLGLIVALSHGDAGGGNPYQFRIALPSMQVKTWAPTVNGPDLIRTKVSAQAYDPEVTGIGVYQLMTVNNQTTF